MVLQQSKACINNEISFRTFNKINLLDENEFKEYFSKNKISNDIQLNVERKEKKN